MYIRGWYSNLEVMWTPILRWVHWVCTLVRSPISKKINSLYICIYIYIYIYICLALVNIYIKYLHRDNYFCGFLASGECSKRPHIDHICTKKTFATQSNFIEITLHHGCSPVNLLHIFRTPFPKNTYGGLLLHMCMYDLLKLVGDG